MADSTTTTAALPAVIVHRLPHFPVTRMADSTTTAALPAVIVHRLPHFPVHFFSPLSAHYHLLSPADPDFQTLSTAARALLCVGPTPVDSTTLDQFPSVEIVIGTSAGTNHFDLAECESRGVRVTSAGDAFGEDVADYAVALLIDVFRRITIADRYVRDGSWKGKGTFPLASKLGGKRLGIVGLGSIGSLVAKRLESFGCIIAYKSRKKRPEVSYPYYENILDLAADSDALILCCALTEETHHLINKDVMTALGKKGVIINIGRGALIDEKELVQFLLHGDLGGAALDVFENEPNVPSELFDLDNVVLSPHKAVATPESFAALLKVVGGNLEAFFCNKPLLSPIDF